MNAPSVQAEAAPEKRGDFVACFMLPETVVYTGLSLTEASGMAHALLVSMPAGAKLLGVYCRGEPVPHGLPPAREVA